MDGQMRQSTCMATPEMLASGVHAVQHHDADVGGVR